MAAPPAKRSKVPTISLVVEEWKESQVEQFSPVHRIHGVPWRLRLYKKNEKERSLSLICDMSTEAELWKCNGTITTADGTICEYSFNSWEAPQEKWIMTGEFPEGVGAEVEITSDDNGWLCNQRWTPCPILDPLDPRDGILVIGEKKIQVNKESLAHASTFFKHLFYRHLIDNKNEFEIEDVGYEEFINIIRLFYRFDGASLTDTNVLKVLQLARNFDLESVVNRAISFLLSTSCSFSIHKKLLISEQHNVRFLKDNILAQYANTQLKDVSDSEEFEQLSPETIRVLMKKCSKFIP